MSALILTLLLYSCFPSISLAWCNNGLHISRIRGVNGGTAKPQPLFYSFNARLKLSDAECNLYRSSTRLWNAVDSENDGAVSGKDQSYERNYEEKDQNLTGEKALALISKFLSMSLPYYQESKAGRRLFYGMILLTLLNSGVSVAFSYISKDFWNALSSKDVQEFYSMILKFGGALVVGAPVSVLYRFQREQLAVHWREWMTDRTLQLYNSNRVYYALERDVLVSEESVDSDKQISQSKLHVDNVSFDQSSVNRIDNPDQRITEDVRTFTAFSLQLFITVVTSLIDLVSFSLILYSIQPQLFATIIGYALFGTLATTYIGSSLLPLNFAKLSREADLRYLLVRIRENAESIAFYGGEDVEGKEVSSRLSRVIKNRREINVAQRNLEFFTTAYQYLIQVVPVVVVAPQYFAGAIQLGVISQSVGAFNHILNDVSVIVNQFEQLSSFSAGIERLSTFMIAMRNADPARRTSDGLLTLPKYLNHTFNTLSDQHSDCGKAAEIEHLNDCIKLRFIELSSSTTDSPNAILSIQQLHLMTPNKKRSLIQNLNLTVPEGVNMIILGKSGAGKSSLLRAIAGLWTSGTGQITRVPDDEVYFLPQRPYCALGSLKDQLLYPSTEALKPEDYPQGHRLSQAHLLRQALSDQDLIEVLAAVDLGELPYRFGDGDPVKGLNVVVNWSNTLSLGEQQRLAFGRLIVNQPRLVIMDEATSALDIATESKMYSLLRGFPGLTYISVGHRPTLLPYHDFKLVLNGGSEYSLEAIEKSSVSNSDEFAHISGV